MISGELRRYLRDFNQIKVSRSLRDLAYQAMQAKERLTTNLQKEPTVSEIAAEIGAKREDVVVALESVSEPVSIYEPVYSESGDALYVLDQISERDTMENWLGEMPYDSWEHGNRIFYTSASFRGKPRQKWQRKSAFHRHRFPDWKKMRFYRCGTLPICITIPRAILYVRRGSAWAYPTKFLARHTICLRNFYAICRKI